MHICFYIQPWHHFIPLIIWWPPVVKHVSMQNKHSNSTRKNQWKFTCSMTIFQKISPIHCRRKREGDFSFEIISTCTDNIKTNDQFFLHICSRQVFFLKIKPHKPDSKIGIKPLNTELLEPLCPKNHWKRIGSSEYSNTLLIGWNHF